MARIPSAQFPVAKQLPVNEATPGTEANATTRDYGEFTPWVRLFTPLRTLAFWIMLQNAIGPTFTGAQFGDAVEYNRGVFYTWFAASMFVLLVFVVHLPVIWRYIVGNLDVVAFMGMAVFREAMTNDLGSVLTALGYVGVFGAAATLCLVDGVGVMLQRLFLFSLYIVIVSLAGFAFPAFTTMRGNELAGFYKGFHNHRNVLGMALNISTAAILAMPMIFLFRFVLLVCCVGIMVATGSAQGLIFTVLAIALFAVYGLDRRAPGIRRMGIIAVILFCSAIYVVAPDTASSELFDAVGRDSSFSGRDRIWGLAYYMIQSLPLFGYGMNSFSSSALDPSLLAMFGLGTKFGSAHSSYLEAILSFGWIGAGLFFFVVARHTLRVVLALFSLNTRRSALPVALTLFCVVGGFVEAERLFQPGTGWLTFVLAKLFFDLGATGPTQQEVGPAVRSSGARRQVMFAPGHGT
jgi:O-antigen ligase